MEPTKRDFINPLLTRLAERRSNDIGLEVAAARIGDAPVFYFVARELLIGADENDLLASLRAQAATVLKPAPIPPQPIEVARTRRPRTVDFERPFKVRLDPQLQDTDLDDIAMLCRSKYPDLKSRKVEASSEAALALAALAIRLQAQGRDVSLNYLGEPGTLPLANLDVTPAPPEGADPAAWPWFAGNTNMVAAWQLFDSYRQNGSVQNLVWIAIFDNGFDLDAFGVPNAADLANTSALVNLIDNSQPIGGLGWPIAPTHGNDVASCAYAIVENKLEMAGSGGLVARGALFRCNYAFSEAIDCLITAAAWGLDIVNMSYWLRPDFDSDDETSFNKAHEWAANNGVIVVVIAGNDGASLDSIDVRPAARTPGVISVGNIDPATGAAATNSNFGPAVHIWAPGTNIRFAPNAFGAQPMGSGTSFAAPMVAGVVAMMLAIRPNLRVEDVRQILMSSGWTGTDGKVTKGLNALEALRQTIGAPLPEEFEEWAGGGNDAADKAAVLAPIAGNKNRLGPIGGVATHNYGDHDWWYFTLTSIKDVNISLQWYWRLGNLNLYIECADPDGNVDDLRKTAAPGSIQWQGVLGPGTYRVQVTGNAVTAYEIGVKLAYATIAADQFEPNDSFETAAALLFHVSQRAKYVALSRPWWGPGEFGATLHSGFVQVGQFWMEFWDTDFYLLDGRIELGAQQRICEVYNADEAIDVIFYDHERQVVASFPGVRSATFKLQQPQVHFLEVRGLRPTRYKVATYMTVDPTILPGDLDYAEVFPEYWGKSPFIEVGPRPRYYLVRLGDGAGELNPRFETEIALSGRIDRNLVSLLNAQGEVLRHLEPSIADGALRLPIGGLGHGTYFVRIEGNSSERPRETVRLLAPRSRFRG
jgi:hypothetical protein